MGMVMVMTLGRNCDRGADWSGIICIVLALHHMRFHGSKESPSFDGKSQYDKEGKSKAFIGEVYLNGKPRVWSRRLVTFSISSERRAEPNKEHADQHIPPFAFKGPPSTRSTPSLPTSPTPNTIPSP